MLPLAWQGGATSLTTAEIPRYLLFVPEKSWSNLLRATNYSEAEPERTLKNTRKRRMIVKRSLCSSEEKEAIVMYY
jgi:hypothetical protein